MKQSEIYLKLKEFIVTEYSNEPDIYDSGEDCRVMLLNGVEKDDFDRFKRVFLSEFSFDEVRENVIENNYFTHSFFAPFGV